MLFGIKISSLIQLIFQKKSCTLVSWSDSQLVYINTKNNEGASESVVSKKGNHLQHFILLELFKKVTNAICQ